MKRIDLDDHRAWPDDLARWFKGQTVDRQNNWRTSELFLGLDLEQTLTLLDKIKANDEIGAAWAELGNDPADAALTDGELLAKAMQDSQDNAAELIAQQNAANARRDADIIRAALAADTDD